jgi:clan AA aspartic protease
MQGQVSDDLEAVIPLEVRGPAGRRENLPAVVDTGFNGFLVLSHTAIIRLGLRNVGATEAALGDGQSVHLPVFQGAVVWDGELRDVSVIGAEGGPLIGMSILRNCDLRIQIRPGGRVEVIPIP